MFLKIVPRNKIVAGHFLLGHTQVMGFEGYYVLVLVFLLRVALQFWQTNSFRWTEWLWLISGWLIGYSLVRIEAYLAKGALKQYLGEALSDRAKSPFRNVLTGMTISLLAVWIVTSSSGLLGAGVVTGIAVRLYTDMLNAKNPQNWFWIFAREFGEKEKKLIKIVWGVLVGLALVILI